MTDPNLPQSGADARKPKLVSRPRQYVDVNDLRQMLKLGLGLHSLGDPIKRLNRALAGLSRLAGADAWVAAALGPNAVDPLSFVLSGGKDAKAAVIRLESDHRRPRTSIGRFIATPKQTPGRVLAVIDQNENAVHSILRPEKIGPSRSPMTWISIHRTATKTPFLERERRMVELFHSQSAWLLLRASD